MAPPVKEHTWDHGHLNQRGRKDLFLGKHGFRNISIAAGKYTAGVDDYRQHLRLLRLAQGHTGDFFILETLVEQSTCCHLAPVGTVDKKDLILAIHGMLQELLDDTNAILLAFHGWDAIALGKQQAP